MKSTKMVDTRRKVRLRFAGRSFPYLYRIVGVDAAGKEVPGTRQDWLDPDMPSDLLGARLFDIDKRIKNVVVMRALIRWKRVHVIGK